VAAAAAARVDAARTRLADAEAARLLAIAARVDEAVARILADAERHVAERRARRERWLTDHAARAERLLDVAASTVASFLRDRPRKKTL
jgi:hypothetical protein